jgi:hypothetical protein
MISVEIDARDINRVIRELRATDMQVKRALNSTLRKMASWVKTRSIRGLSSELQIQQKIIRRRLRTIKAKKTPGGGAEVKVWYGLDPIGLIYLGAKQNKQGVRAAGGRQVKGAFIAKMRGGGRNVFKRKGKARLPIEKQEADIEGKAERFLDDGLLNSPSFMAQFFKTLTHELKWQTRTPK